MRACLKFFLCHIVVLSFLFLTSFFSVNKTFANPSSITDLGTLPGDSESSGNDLNNLGHVAGLSAQSAIEGCDYFGDTCGYHGFIYSNGTITPSGNIPGGSSSYGLAINDSDQLVGFGSNGTSLVRGFLSNNGTVTDLGTLGGSDSIPYDINNSGQIVGWAKDSNNLRRAFLYQNGSMTDIGSLPGDDEAEGYGISDNGVIAGWSYSSTTGAGDCQIYASNCVYHAFTYSNGNFTNLGTLPGGTQSRALRVNDSGKVVGFSNSGSSDIHGFLYQNGTMTDLGVLPGGTVSLATDINSSGDIVGFGNVSGGSFHGFIYRDGTMTDLNDLLPPTSGWNIIYAYGINDSEQITGEGSFNGVRHGFLMTIAKQNIILNVPSIKQTNNLWKNQTYDSANIWNSSDPSINAWGCALTSAAMVFKYHGINKLPDGKNLDPGSLNEWLKKQKDGYIGNGALNWLALSRLSKQAKNINGLSFNALEYTRTNGYDPNKLTEALNNNLPGILREPGHFVVGKGIAGGTFSINDPYYSRTSLSDYGNTFQNLGVYTPSSTDLSYIMLTVGINTDIQLLDSGGNSVGEIFLEESIVNPENSAQNNGNMKILYLQKPAEDDYRIVLNSAGDPDYELKVYLYDKNGDVFTRTETGALLSEQNITIPLHFDGQEELYPHKVTFLSTTLDIERLYKQRRITKISVKRDLGKKLARAFVQKILHNEERELEYLMEFEEILNENNGTKILPTAYEILLYDVNYLETHL